MRRLYETEEEMSHEGFWGFGFEEEVHEYLEPGEIDILKRRATKKEEIRGLRCAAL